MTRFIKLRTCPPSETLLAFANRDLAGDEHFPVRLHLKVCEFCSAEFGLYRSFPIPTVPPEPPQPPKIPRPLKELAESVIGGDGAGRDSGLEGLIAHAGGG